MGTVENYPRKKTTQFVSNRKREEDDDSIEAKIDKESKMMRLSDKIPVLETDEINNAKQWNRDEMIALLGSGRVPDSIDEFSYAKLRVLPYFPKVVMFIYAFKSALDSHDVKPLKNFDPDLEFLSFRGLRRGIQACLELFEKYPERKNLAELFDEVGKRVKEMK